MSGMRTSAILYCVDCAGMEETKDEKRGCVSVGKGVARLSYQNRHEVVQREVWSVVLISISV